MLKPPSVSLDNFEGPLDLLLYLIQRNEINIYDIPIQSITKQFLLEFFDRESAKVDFGAEFLGLTSTLLLWKSQKILPSSEAQSELIEEIAPYINMLKELVEYCTFKEIAKKLAIQEEEGLGCFRRGIFNPEKEERAPLAETGLALKDLTKLLENILSRSAKPVGVIEDKSYLVSDKITYLREILAKESTISFEQLFPIEKSRDELIVTFLALLQLMKQGELTVEDLIIKAKS